MPRREQITEKERQRLHEKRKQIRAKRARRREEKRRLKEKRKAVKDANRETKRHHRKHKKYVRTEDEKILQWSQDVSRQRKLVRLMTNEKLIELYRIWHERKTKVFSGTTTLDDGMGDYIHDLIQSNGVKTVLDYGCGKAAHYESPHDYHVRWGLVLKPVCYDPAVLRFAEKPVKTGQFDFVMAIDVLEHILEQDIPDILDELCDYARNLVFVSIAMFPGNKFLPNGLDPHVTLKSKQWWREQIRDAIQRRQRSNKQFIWHVFWREFADSSASDPDNYEVITLTDTPEGVERF